MKEEFGLTDYQLEKKCTPEHLKEIAPFVGNYLGFASKFGIPDGHLANITKSDSEFVEKTGAIFLFWRKNNRNPLYKNFIQICIDLRKGDIATKMCELCAEGPLTLSSTDDREIVPSEKASGQVSSDDQVKPKPSRTGTVADEIDRFEKRFIDLRTAALEEFADSNVSVSKFRRKLMILPASIQNENKDFVLSKHALFQKAESIEGIFVHLDFYVSVIDFSLLEHIIKEFGSKQLKELMSCYAQDMMKFKARTTISDALKHLHKHDDPPGDFSRLTVKIDFDADVATLENLDEYRKRFASGFLLSSLVFFLFSTSKGSLLVTWLVPTVLVAFIKDEVTKKDASFFSSNKILKLSLEGKQLYSTTEISEGHIKVTECKEEITYGATTKTFCGTELGDWLKANGCLLMFFFVAILFVMVAIRVKISYTTQSSADNSGATPFFPTSFNWTDWLKTNGQHLVTDGFIVYGDLLHKRDTTFNGNAMHGLARSSPSFTFKELEKIVDHMPKKQLAEGDADKDLPVHSAINSMADADMISLFVQGTFDERKKILESKNDEDKTPIEVAFDKRQTEVIIKLFDLCVEHDVLPDLTGIGAKEGSSTLLHIAFDENVWPWFLKTVIDTCQKYKLEALPAIQVMDSDGYSPFEYLMNNCFPSTDKYAKVKEFKEVISILQKYEIDINLVHTNSKRATMLHEAYRKNDLRCLEILEPLTKSDVKDAYGRTPLERAHYLKKNLKNSVEGHTTQFSASYSYALFVDPDTVIENGWEEWLTENAEKLYSPDVSASEVYGRELIEMRDRQFNGTAMHGLARSCQSFTTEQMGRIVSGMPKKQLLQSDFDGDLPIHSAINSLADGKMVALFVQGDQNQQKEILEKPNGRDQTPIQLAFDKRDYSAVEKLYNLCVEKEILPHLTGFTMQKGSNSTTLLHNAFDRDDQGVWPLFLNFVITAISAKKAPAAMFRAIQVFDRYNCTPFHYLMNCMNPKHYEKESHLSAFTKVIVLLENNKIDLNKILTDSKGRTMLHEAKRKNYEECSDVLIAHGHLEVEDIKGVKPSQRDHNIKAFIQQEQSSINGVPIQCTSE